MQALCRNCRRRSGQMLSTASPTTSPCASPQQFLVAKPSTARPRCCRTSTAISACYWRTGRRTVAHRFIADGDHVVDRGAEGEISDQSRARATSDDIAWFTGSRAAWSWGSAGTSSSAHYAKQCWEDSGGRAPSGTRVGEIVACPRLLHADNARERRVRRPFAPSRTAGQLAATRAGGSVSVLGGFQEFFRCANTALRLKCQSCWLWFPFGNQLFCILKFWFGQYGSHLIHFVFGRNF